MTEKKMDNQKWPRGGVIVSIRDGNLVMQPKSRRYSEYMRGLGTQMWEKVDATEYVRKERESWEERS